VKLMPILVVVLGAAITVQAATVSELRRDWGVLLDDWDDRSDLDGFPFLECFGEAADAYRLPLPLLVGLAWGESAFDPTARSSKNAIGLMQILWPSTAQELGFQSLAELEDPCRNIRGGARYLRGLFDRVEGDTVLALASYNHGPNAIDGNDSNLNDHARWYVRYIYDKTAAVLAGRRWADGAVVLRLGRFTDYEMARVSMSRYRRIARTRESVELDLTIQRAASGGYDLRIVCQSPSGVAVERARYERITGFRPH
jgi:hypothetical protein